MRRPAALEVSSVPKSDRRVTARPLLPTVGRLHFNGRPWACGFVGAASLLALGVAYTMKAAAR
jgi:hypothetical protein